MANELDQIATQMSAGPQTTELDPTTKRLLEAQKKRLGENSTEQLLAGVGQAGPSGLLSAQPAYDYSVALGGDSARSGAAVADAISGRNQRNSNDYINTMKNQLAMMAPARDAEKLRGVGKNIAAETEVALQNNKIIKQFDLDKRRVEQYKQQRKDSILAGILGVIGTITGVGVAAATGSVAAGQVAQNQTNSAVNNAQKVAGK